MSDSQKKNKKKKTQQCRNELTKLKYLVVKGIIAKFLLHLDAFKFLRPALTIRDFFFCIKQILSRLIKALK